MTYLGLEQVVGCSPNQMQVKILSRMRLKDDLDPILINLSNLEGFSPKKLSSEMLEMIFKLWEMLFVLENMQATWFYSGTYTVK